MRVVFSLALVLLAIGCEADLGVCDPTMATQVIYSNEGAPYYLGQALVSKSCSGSLCHSANAVGSQRVGAPHGLNFDVDPVLATSAPTQLATLTAGIHEVRDEASDMWGEIDDGAMPPGKAGAGRTPGEWRNAAGMDVALPAIQTSQGKDIVRNWLACGAPAVASSGAPVDPSLGVTMAAIAPRMVTGTGFAPIYGVLKDKCIACHVAGGLFPSIDLTSQTTAYASLVGKDSMTGGMCAGKGKLVTPSSCMTSLLYLKLSATTVPCGAPMPLSMDPLPDPTRQAICNWINAGAPQ